MHPLAARFALFSWAALLILCMAWELWLAPLRPGGSWLWIKALPIALTLPGLMRRNATAMQVALLVSPLYLLEATLRVFDPWPISALAVAELALVGAFFVSAVAVLRPLKRAAKARALLERKARTAEEPR